MQEGMAAHSSILALESQGQRSLAGTYSPQGSRESGVTEAIEQAHIHLPFSPSLHLSIITLSNPWSIQIHYSEEFYGNLHNHL